jgi:tRNA G37 N-methylase TrmD
VLKKDAAVIGSSVLILGHHNAIAQWRRRESWRTKQDRFAAENRPAACRP